MSRRLSLLVVLFLLPGIVHAADGPRQKGILARSIQLLEEPEEKKGPFPMPFGTTPQDVDINSTLRIRVSQDDLLTGLSGNPVLAGPAQETAALQRSARELTKADALLQNAIADAEQLVRLDLAGQRDTPEFRAIAEKDQAAVRGLLDIVTAHLAALAASPRREIQEHAAQARQRSNEAILGGRLAYAAFVVEEIRWTLERLDAARQELEADSPPLSLVLSASHVRESGTAEIGLPHYNDLPIGVPKSVDKVSLVLTPEQVALQQDAAALAQVLNNAVAGSAGLQEAVRRLLAANGVDLTRLESAVTQVQADVEGLRETDWSRAADDLESRLQETLQSLAAARRAQLEGTLVPAVEELRARTRDLRSNLGGLLLTIQALRGQLSGTSGQSPVDRLIGLLSVTQAGIDLASGDLFQGLRADLDRWVQAAKAVREQTGTVRTAIEGLPDEVREELTGVVEQLADETLGDLIGHLTDLRGAASEVGGEFRTLFARLRGAPALAVDLSAEPPAAAFRVAFKDLKDTWVDLRTLNPRSEDDVVVLRAWLYRMAPDPADPGKLIEAEELDSEVQQLHILRFGWYTDPGVGVVYASSAHKLEREGDTGPAKERRAFAPYVSWLFHRRAWQVPAADPAAPPPFRSQPSWWSSLAAGLHTLALDLDGDNQQELGLGVSLSFLNNYLQIGAGWDLSLDDEPYLFIGTRLLDLARGMGVSHKPAVAEEE